MNMQTLAEKISAGVFNDILQRDFSQDMISELEQMNAVQLEHKLKDMLEVPISISKQRVFEYLQLYYSASWQNLFTELNMPRALSLLEVGAGDVIYIPKAVDAYSHEAGSYVTANLNRDLTHHFQEKTKGMDVSIRVVEDDAANIGLYYPESSFDVVAYHHAINDIIQTIIADREGMDTVNQDWWTIEPLMLQAVMDYHRKGTLKDAAYQAFIQIMDTSCKQLKSGGYMIFDNITYAGYDEMGYSSEFHNDYIQLARNWISEASLGLEEIEIDSYDKQWWMIWRKV
ncbi:hypothetical protein H0178_49745 [Cytobacillus firmus]|uniref:hypothetical protein n=1 Tax=Paenibacillus lautus TaxID=1401 RepID=UPI00384D1690|nr:hypothetical protein [Cytobacillus firmus]